MSLRIDSRVDHGHKLIYLCVYERVDTVEHALSDTAVTPQIM